MDTNEKRLLYTLAAVQFTNIMDFMIMMPMAPMLRETFHISPTQFGALVSAYSISAGISGLLAAFWVDKFDRKSTLLLMYLGFLIGTFICALSPTYWFFMIARGLTGVFGGVLGSTVLAIVGDTVPHERRATAMGIVMMAFSMAAALGVPFGLFLSAKFSWNVPFFAVVGLGLPILYAIHAFVPQLKQHLAEKRAESSAFKHFWVVLKNSNHLLAYALIFCLVMGQFSIVPYISQYLVSNLAFPKEQLFYIYLVGGIATMISSPWVGRIADKYGKLKIFQVMVLLSFVPFLAMTHLSTPALFIVLVVGTLFFVFAAGRMVPASAMITSATLPKHRGTFMSIYSFTQQISSGLASFIGGLIVVEMPNGHWERYNYVGYLAVIMGLLAIWLAHHLKNAADVPVKVAHLIEEIGK
ncbi:MAG: MFS transporter [Bacteroidia bacterium]